MHESYAQGPGFRRFRLPFALWSVALLVSACGSGPAPRATSTPVLMPANNGDPEIHIPLQPPVDGERETMDADLMGVLVLDGGCLYIDEDVSGTRVLPAWPPGYTYSISNDELHIHDESGAIVASTGHRVLVDGGGAPSLAVPEPCSGLPWLIGDPVRRLAFEPYR